MRSINSSEYQGKTGMEITNMETTEEACVSYRVHDWDALAPRASKASLAKHGIRKMKSVRHGFQSKLVAALGPQTWKRCHTWTASHLLHH